MFRYLISLTLLFAIFSVTQAAELKPVQDFTIKDLKGGDWRLSQLKNKATLIVFMSCECPMSNAYIKSINDIAMKYRDQGVGVVGINANAEESVDQIIAHSKEFKVGFPVLKDTEMIAVKSLGVKVNPEAVIIDEKRQIRYRGRIDDGYTGRLKPAPKTSRFDVTAALDELLAGKEVTLKQTQAFGCPLNIEEKKAVAKGMVTYHRDVVPILQSNCQSCHRKGEVAPFSLETYRQAVKWSDGIVSETKDHRMPPWKPEESEFLRGRHRLTEKELNTLAMWVENGMPEGDPKDAPKKIVFPEGWQLGKPDVILEMPTEAVIGATGKDLFHSVVFPTHLGEDKYIAAIEVRPGNPRVVHHTIHAIDTKGRARKLAEQAQKKQKETDLDRGPGYSTSRGMGFIPGPNERLGGWAPGLIPQRLPDDVGQLLPKDADVVVQFHYHRTGKEENDKTRIGLYFSKGPVREMLQSIPVTGFFARIPANEKSFKVDSSIIITEDVMLHWMVPHMHLLGKDIELTAKLPGESEKTLIKIKEWDYNWQEMYELKTPMKLPKGTVLRTKATFDNSADNPLNPFSPPQNVRFGEQTTNEMCFVFCGVSSATPGRKFTLNLGQLR